MLRGKAAWVWGRTVRELGPEKVVAIAKELGIKHLFVLVKSVTGDTFPERVFEVLPYAHREGIEVHAWIVCFKDPTRENVDPTNHRYRGYLLGYIAYLVSQEKDGEFIDGIHLDYIRFMSPSERNAVRSAYVTSFVEEVRGLLDKLHPCIKLSMATIAHDMSSQSAVIRSALLYGQSYEDLAPFVDLFVPMTYYLDLDVSPEQAARAARWIKDVVGTSVFAGVQLHPSENPRTIGRIPTVEEVAKQLEECEKLGLDGVSFFRFLYLYERINELGDVVKKFFA